MKAGQCIVALRDGERSEVDGGPSTDCLVGGMLIAELIAMWRNSCARK